MNARDMNPLHDWIDDDLMVWLKRRASQNGRTVEEEITARLEESRQAETAKKKR